MKNIKTLLSTGVALVIALFVSVQISAMRNPYENPNLTNMQRELVWSMLEDVEGMKKKAEKMLNKPENKSNEEFFRKHIEKQEKRRKAYWDILFDVPYKSYTNKEISDVLQ